MSDLNFQNFSSVQNELQPGFNWVALQSGDNVIAPSSFFTGLSGAQTVQTINPPVSGTHMLVFLLDDNITFGNSGNIAGTLVFAAGTLVFALYNTLNKKYYLSGTVAA